MTVADYSALDGNAIGGLLLEVFGTEMTAAVVVCGSCGASGPMAETVVFLRAPGAVVRCRSCGAVLLVIVRHRQQNCVDMLGIAALET
jgi:hypothetical protein